MISTGSHSIRQYSIAELNSALAAIIRRVEKKGPVQITRRGKPIAILISLDEYQQLQTQTPRRNLWDAIQTWRAENDVAALNINPDEIWGDIRDKSPGREIDF